MRDVTHNEGWMGDPGKKLMRWRTVGRQETDKRLGCQTAHKNWKMIFGRRRIGILASQIVDDNHVDGVRQRL